MITIFAEPSPFLEITLTSLRSLTAVKKTATMTSTIFFRGTWCSCSRQPADNANQWYILSPKTDQKAPSLLLWICMNVNPAKLLVSTRTVANCSLTLPNLLVVIFIQGVSVLRFTGYRRRCFSVGYEYHFLNDRCFAFMSLLRIYNCKP